MKVGKKPYQLVNAKASHPDDRTFNLDLVCIEPSRACSPYGAIVELMDLAVEMGFSKKQAVAAYTAMLQEAVKELKKKKEK